MGRGTNIAMVVVNAPNVEYAMILYWEYSSHLRLSIFHIGWVGVLNINRRA